MVVTLGSIPRSDSAMSWVRSTISDSSCVPGLTRLYCRAMAILNRSSGVIR
jgi:hypothetical protein